MGNNVVDNTQTRRFEIYHDGELAGFSEYHLFHDELAILHTEVDERFHGKGLGRALARGMLDNARLLGRTVQPFCPFVRQWIIDNPAYLDLVTEEQRERFDI